MKVETVLLLVSIGVCGFPNHFGSSSRNISYDVRSNGIGR